MLKTLNKGRMNMVAGRPKEHDREKVFNDLVEWAKLDDSININKFCALHCDPPMPVSNILRWISEEPKFRGPYETAKAFIAFRREEFVSADLLHVKAYDLNSSAYDVHLHSHKRDDLKFESNLKREETKEYSEADKAKIDTIFDQLSSLRSERNIATSNAVSENKS